VTMMLGAEQQPIARSCCVPSQNLTLQARRLAPAESSRARKHGSELGQVDQFVAVTVVLGEELLRGASIRVIERECNGNINAVMVMS